MTTEQETVTKEYITYEYVNDAVNSIVHSIKKFNIEFDYIVGLVRGGCIPGVMLSHRLNVPFIPLMWSTRDHITTETIDWLPQLVNEGKKVLIVEDIIDSGKTLETLYANWGAVVGGVDKLNMSNIYVAALIYNYEQEITAHFYGKMINRSSTNVWYEFFWEQN